MDSLEEAADYDAMDHTAVNRAFVDDLLAALPEPGDPPWQVLDVGTGTALIPLELASRQVTVKITAADAAAHMLRLALKNVVRAGCEGVIRLDHVDAKQLPYVDGEFDVVMSNSIVHHIPEPMAVLREMVRVLRPGGLLFVRDLLRPADETTLNSLVETYAAGANARQKQMFADSLHAALTLGEVRELLKDLSLSPASVQATSDRHWTICCGHS